MGSIKSNFAYNSAYQILKMLTPLLTTPYLARVLGAEQIGLFSFTQSIANYFIMFAVLGLSKYAVREIARCTNRSSRSKTFWEIFSLQFCQSSIVLLIYLIFASAQKGDAIFLTLVWVPWIVSAVIDISWLFFGVEDFKRTTLRSMVVKIVELISIFIFVKTQNDLWLYILLVAGEFLISQLVLWPFIKKYIDWVRPSFSGIAKHIVPNIKLFIPVIATSLYSSMDIIILGNLSTMQDTGYYQYSYRITTLPLAVITAMGTVMLPHMSRLMLDDNRQRISDSLNNTFWFVSLISFGFTFGIFSIVEIFVPVFFGDGYNPCIAILSVLSITIPLIGFTDVLGVQYLLPSLRDKMFTISVWAGAIVNLVLSLPLVYFFGALGCAIGTVAAEATVLLVQILYCRKDLPLLQFFSQLLPMIIGGGFMIAVTRFAHFLLSGFIINAVVLLLVEIVIGALSYCIPLFLYFKASRNARYNQVIQPVFDRLIKKS